MSSLYYREPLKPTTEHTGSLLAIIKHIPLCLTPKNLQSASGRPSSTSEARLPDTQLWRFLHHGRDTSRRARRGELPNYSLTSLTFMLPVWACDYQGHVISTCKAYSCKG